MILLLLGLGCPSPGDDTADSTAPDDGCSLLDPGRDVTGDYDVAWRTDPTPLVATEPGELRFQILGPDGAVVDDLQQSHERMVHVLFISSDLESFQHVHHEDTNPVTAETLRCGDWRLGITLPYAGRYRLGFDYAHANQWIVTHDWLDADGAIPQLDAPRIDEATQVEVGGMVVDLTWDTAPIAGFEAQWSVNITEGGADVTDLVQWLGADAHAVVTSADLEFLSHTHAWVPGMENMTPGMEMPHQYPGPYVPFHFTFPTAGWHKMWIQFARADAPEVPYTAAFWFEVAP